MTQENSDLSTQRSSDDVPVNQHRGLIGNFFDRLKSLFGRSDEEVDRQSRGDSWGKEYIERIRAELELDRAAALEEKASGPEGEAADQTAEPSQPPEGEELLLPAEIKKEPVYAIITLKEEPQAPPALDQPEAVEALREPDKPEEPEEPEVLEVLEVREAPREPVVTEEVAEPESLETPVPPPVSAEQLPVQPPETPASLDLALSEFEELRRKIEESLAESPDLPDG